MYYVDVELIPFELQCGNAKVARCRLTFMLYKLTNNGNVSCKHTTGLYYPNSNCRVLHSILNKKLSGVTPYVKAEEKMMRM